jgi:outer membrane lipoprotein LolB
MPGKALRFGAALLLCALSACRTAPLTFPAVAPWEVRRPQLQARASFDLRGRVAVATGAQGFNANLSWEQKGPRSHLTLSGPLGSGAVEVNTSGDELDIATASGQHLDSAAARAELAARLGFDPPLSSLRFWILGVPDPTVPATERLDAHGQRLEGLTQAGWHIDYTQYVAVGPDWLPARLTLKRDTVRVRLLVDEWQ